MNLFNLSAKLTLDKSDYENKIEDAKKEGKDFSEKTEKQIGIISADAWTNLAGKVINVAKQIAQASLETINYVDNIGDLAGKWGFTTQEIQEFDYWATMSGTTLESLLTGMRGLVNQAEAGASAFDKLGIKVKNNDGTLKGQKQLFLETIDALQKIPNQTERNALQFEIFGRAGIELGQVINRSASELQGLTREAEELGIILSEDTVESAGKFNDELDKIRLKGKTAFAELIAGEEGAEERFDEFTKDLIEKVEMLAPVFFEIGERLGKVILEAMLKRIGNVFKEKLLQSVGKGWLWGKEETPNSLNELLENATSTIDNSYSSSDSSLSSVMDNSTTNVTVNMTSSGYTSEDAKALANEVIKEIATKKQASGR